VQGADRSCPVGAVPAMDKDRAFGLFDEAEGSNDVRGLDLSGIHRNPVEVQAGPFWTLDRHDGSRAN